MTSDSDDLGFKDFLAIGGILALVVFGLAFSIGYEIASPDEDEMIIDRDDYSQELDEARAEGLGDYSNSTFYMDQEVNSTHRAVGLDVGDQGFYCFLDTRKEWIVGDAQNMYQEMDCSVKESSDLEDSFVDPDFERYNTYERYLEQRENDSDDVQRVE